MRKGRPVTPIVLTGEERRVLRRWSKRMEPVSHREALRARIVLALAEPAATAGNELAARIRVSPQTVSLWRRRFVTGRIAGLRHRRA